VNSQANYLAKLVSSSEVENLFYMHFQIEIFREVIGPLWEKMNKHKKFGRVNAKNLTNI
jgi:hypothetical protein